MIAQQEIKFSLIISRRKTPFTLNRAEYCIVRLQDNIDVIFVAVAVHLVIYLTLGLANDLQTVLCSVVEKARENGCQHNPKQHHEKTGRKYANFFMDP